MRSLVDGRSETAKLFSAFADIAEAAARGFGGGGKRWSLVDEPGGLGVWTTVRGKARRVGAAESLAGKVLQKLKSGTVELRLDSEKLVSATLKLPAEAREFAAPFVEHSLEKLTPWRADKVLFGYAVSPKPGADGQHEVHLIATSRDIAETLLAPARALGIEPAALGSAGEPLDRPLQVNLLKGASDRLLRRRRKIGLVAAAVLLITSSLFGVSQWLAWDMAGRQNQLEAQLADIRQKIAANTGTGGERSAELAMIQAKTPQSAAFLLIDRLAKLLPDSTTLDELEIKPETVRIAGTSADASALVGLLEADTFLRDAQFGAPVVRQLDGRDRFDIVLSRQTPGDPDSP